MFKYQKYLIKTSDRFDAAQYPGLDEKIALITKELDTVPDDFKIEMLLSFLKDHLIKTEWAAVNPILAEMISSGNLPLSDLENLFESSRKNPAYQDELTAYIKNQFSASYVAF